MKIHFDFSVLQKVRWYEYAVRFLFGGSITVLAGILAKRFGPVFGGLFLAFPAIFPASATLVEKHEEEKKRSAGIPHTIRGKQSAAVDARGAAMGSIGLVGFALVLWKLLPVWSGGLALLAATAVWIAISVLCWRSRKWFRSALR